jgi:hypothetical protein
LGNHIAEQALEMNTSSRGRETLVATLLVFFY